MRRSGGDEGSITRFLRDHGHDQSQMLAQLQKTQPDTSLLGPPNEEEGGERDKQRERETESMPWALNLSSGTT